MCAVTTTSRANSTFQRGSLAGMRNQQLLLTDKILQLEQPSYRVLTITAPNSNW